MLMLAQAIILMCVACFLYLIIMCFDTAFQRTLLEYELEIAQLMNELNKEESNNAQS